MTKRVSVTMSDEDAAILKEYAAFFETNQSDVMYLFTRAAIHSHALSCKKVASLLDLRNKQLDKRVGKPCFGYGCLACEHSTACTTGIYKGTISVYEDRAHLIKDNSPLEQLIKHELTLEPVPACICA